MFSDSAQENNVAEEARRVCDAIATAKCYSDMQNFCTTCKSWLVVLIMMSPSPESRRLNFARETLPPPDDDPLSPTSRSLRSEARLGTITKILNVSNLEKN